MVARINVELQKILSDAEALQLLSNAGMQADYMASEKLGQLKREDSTRWLRVARGVNLTQ